MDTMKKLFTLSMITVLVVASVGYSVIYDIQKELTQYGNLKQSDLQNDLPNIYDVACGPVAVTNSLRYLENHYPGDYGTGLTNGNLVQTAVTLAGLMKTAQPHGTYADDLIWFKRKYIEQAVPGVTIYGAQYAGGWNVTDDGNPVPAPSWLESVNPTWQWLYQELVHCEDVEILFSWTEGGHYVTLTSFHWDDINNDGLIQQSENAKIDFIDPGTGQNTWANIWQSGSILETNYSEGAWISMAVKESPEPATVFLLTFGSVLIFRRKR